MPFEQDGEFQKLLRGIDQVDLVGLLLEYARSAYPQLDASATRAELDCLGDAARLRLARLPTRCHPADRLRALSRFLYQTAGFRGNDADYYDPRNSLINDVVERRLGIPITLGIVYQAVAARSGISMVGIGMPGHFVLAFDPADDERWYVDPFTAGRVMDRDECIAVVEERIGRRGVVREEHLRPATPSEIAVRVLRNLKTCYVMRDEWNSAMTVQRRLTLLLPHAAAEFRDLGLMLLRTGEPREAADLLQRYSAACSPAERNELATYLKAARRMLAELN